MGNFFKTTKCKIILFILALLVGVMIYAVSQGGYTISSIGVFNALISPFQHASNAISERVEHVLDMYSNAQSYYDENQTLKQEISDLHAQLADYEAAKEELAELQEFMGIKEENPDFALTSPFDVVGYVANDPYRTFIIDGGSEDGVSLYDPVMTAQGMVGMITELGTDTATVSTILSPDVYIAALSSKTREKGIVTGNISMLLDGCCKMEYLEKETGLQKDHVILTSGENGYFPRGCVIGFVQETGLEATGLSAYAKIRPAVDLANLTKVVVITDFSGKEGHHEKEQH